MRRHISVHIVQLPTVRYMRAPYHRADHGVKGYTRISGTLGNMDDPGELDPTIAMPRVEVPPRNVTPTVTPAATPTVVPAATYQAPPVVPIPPARTPTPVPIPAAAPLYVFGNPLLYALRRFLAFALDLVVVTGVSTMLLYGLIALNPFTGLPNNSEGGFDATFIAGVAIAFVYIALFEAVFGTTLGKLAFSLHVYVPRGRFVGLGRALIRNLVRPLDFFVIGWILALLPGHRRLGDLFAGTIVARSPLRAFSPLVGWVLIIALVGLPFIVAGGIVTVLAVAAAFVQFIPPLLIHAFAAILALFGVAAPHAPA